jgi:Cdc6-like AAA superfamily ATPase
MVGNDDWSAKAFEASQLFSPAAPINEADLFAGRSTEIRKLLEAVTERGKHVVLFGERGVGKTSLAGIFAGLFPDTLRHIQLIREQVDPSDDFTSIWKKVFKDIHVKESRVGKEELVAISEFYDQDIKPDDVRRELEGLFGPNDLPIIVIDEFDKSESDDTHELMANTIKALSDYSVNVTVVLVGVADDINELIGEHSSLTRCIEQVPMPRMNTTEMREIIDKRVPKLGMKMDGDAYFKILELSRGLPAYVHLLGLYSVRSALDRKNLTVIESDVDSAIHRTLERSQESIQENYTRAVHSNRSDSLYRHVLLSCALAKTDERGQFTPQSICAPLSTILKKDVRIDTFQQHLKKFIQQERAEVLIRKGRERAYKFRFRDPMMQPYVIMRGIEENLVSADAINALSFPVEPEFDFSTEPLPHV